MESSTQTLPQVQDAIRPFYLGGNELNHEPDHTQHHRYVIYLERSYQEEDDADSNGLISFSRS